METFSLTGTLYAKMIESGAAKLNLSRVVVNELNVFPIPDGDTGDNMFMTIDAGFSSLLGESTDDLGLTSKRISQGMLLGARGNSGVILSRIFFGISKGLEGAATADVRKFASAMEVGVEESYHAVQTPVEGTILTVYSDAVRYANSRISDHSSFEQYFDDLIKELRESLDRTPTLLNVLKEAGVVDSGGAGFVYIAEGMRDALDGISISQSAPAVSSQRVKAVNTEGFTKDSVLKFGYCTEFLLRLQTVKVGNVSEFDENPLIDWLIANGESVVAFREGSILKVHVHTMFPEQILAHCHEYGEFLTLKIENMMLQNHQATIRNNYTKKKRPHKKYGIVAVAAGEGIRNTFLSIGADAVVDGGQSMNPSAESFLDAFSSVDADVIFVYPNNSNIILTAEQAACLYPDGRIIVLPSHTIGECYAALSLLDLSSDDPDIIRDQCISNMQSVRTGTVSKANRTTERDGVSVKKGDYIGFSDGTIYSDAATATEAAIALSSALHAEDYGVLLLVCGSEAEPDQSEKLKEALEHAYPLTEVILLDGGQPIYDYILILE